MTRRALLAATVATSLCLAAAGLATAADPKPTQLPVQKLPDPVVVGIKVLKKSDSSLVAGGNTNGSSLVVPFLFKDTQYKVVVTFGTPLAQHPFMLKGQAPVNASTAKADGQVRVGNSLSQQAKILDPATKPVSGLAAGKTTTQEWDYKAAVGGQHQFTGFVK
jgi:hypothetical protein